MKDLRATQASLKETQTLESMNDEFAKLLKSQRDDAFKQLEKQPPSLPWYLWTALGAAGATVLIRGVR